MCQQGPHLWETEASLGAPDAATIPCYFFPFFLVHQAVPQEEQASVFWHGYLSSRSVQRYLAVSSTWSCAGCSVSWALGTFSVCCDFGAPWAAPQALLLLWAGAVETGLGPLRVTCGSWGWPEGVGTDLRGLRMSWASWGSWEKAKAEKDALKQNWGIWDLKICLTSQCVWPPDPSAGASPCCHLLPPPHSYLGGRPPREQLLETIHGKLSMVSSTFFQKSPYKVSHYTWCHQEPVCVAQAVILGVLGKQLYASIPVPAIGEYLLSKIKHFSLVSKLQGWLLYSLE